MFHDLIVSYLTRRLSEPSTYAGIAGLLASHLAITFDPSFAGQLTQVAMDVGSLLAIVLKDGGHVWTKDAAVHDAGTITTKGLNEEEAARHQ
jgi:hypothetical protein